MTDNQIRVGLGLIYGGAMVNCWWGARRLRHGDPIRVMLIWLAVSAASWSVAFLVAVIHPEWLGRWVSLFLLGVTWPAFIIGFIRFAWRWHRAVKGTTGE